MAENIKLVRVFIASPGGLEEEREAAREIVKEINQANADHWGCQIKLVGWEDTLPGFSRPQSKINQDLDRCSYFIGLIWDRWGTPPTTEKSGPTSGFEEEYLRALAHLDAGTMLDLAMYFKAVEVPPGMQPGPDIKKVLQFREQCIREKKFLFQDFKEIEEFKSIIRAKMIEIGWRETEILERKADLSKQDEKVPKDKASSESSPRLIDGQALEFVSNFSQRSADWDATSSTEVARFRLIASSIGRSGNDDLHLGNHDANLIFRQRDELSFSTQEIRALIDTGVAKYSSQNVPLWYWLNLEGGESTPFSRIAGLTNFGNDIEKKSALEILAKAKVSIRKELTEELYEYTFMAWLSEEAKEPVFNAALQFIETLDEETDLALLKSAAEKAGDARARSINSVLATLIAKGDPNQALELIAEHGSDKISKRGVDRIFSNTSVLSTDVIKKAMESRAEVVRENALEILFERAEFSYEEAMTWAADSNYNIRVIAIQALEKLGRPLGGAEIEKLLVQKSFGGILGRSSNNEGYLHKYRDSKLRDMTFKELDIVIKEVGVLCHRELAVLYDKFGSRIKDDLKNRIEDGHSAFYRECLDAEEALSSVGNETRQKLHEMGSAPRELMTSAAFASLAKFGDANDLDFIRSKLDTGKDRGGFKSLEFLAKFGDWSDRERITQMDFGLSSLALLGTSDYDEQLIAKANALLKIGSHRIVDLLNSDVATGILRHVVMRMSKKDFVSLPDTVILDQMNRPDDKYRVAFAARSVIELTQKRLLDLLNKYVDADGYRYYNTIHWLDLGASASRSLAKCVARTELNGQG